YWTLTRKSQTLSPFLVSTTFQTDFIVRRIPPRRIYCWLRGCCPGRDDNCIFQYNARNATCYCDEFCASEPPDSIDCCPDFWLVCHKHTPEHIRPQVQQWGKCYVPTSSSTRQKLMSFWNVTD
uniref:SMB domain-containing protein n=1 Tax=Laticauda laticaudata TaxID=8630 RepID=A0A8C5SZC0_LATLA